MSFIDDGGYDYGSDQGDGTSGMQDDVMDELIEIENAYYEGDDLRVENPSAAIELFIKVVDMETRRGDDVKWYFFFSHYNLKIILKIIS